MNYEQAFEKLEEISNKLVAGNTSLEESTKLFEEAIALSKVCYEKLKQTEGQLLVFKKEIEELKPLDVK